MIYKIVYISFFLMFLLSFSSGCSSEEKDIPDPDSGIPGGDEGSDDGDKETDKVSPFMCTPYNSDKFIRASLTVALILNIGRILKTTSLQPGLSFRKM